MRSPQPITIAIHRLERAVASGFAEKMYKSEAAALLELVESHIGLLKAAQEMIEVLAVEPTGPLWPGREELARGYIGWHQRLERAKEACPIKAIKKDAL